MVLLILAGCTDARKQAGRKLAESVDQARRLYNTAAALRADPRYILDVETGRLLPIEASSLSTQPAAAAAGRVENALKPLEKARKLLERSLAENVEAPVGIKADANLMLGQIKLAKGRYHVTGAETMRAEAARARYKAQSLLRLVRAKISLAAFYGSLESMPRDNIDALRKKPAGEAYGLAGKIKSAKGEIARLEGEIDKLSTANKKQFAEASRLRDRSEVTGGPEGLKLWKDATDIDAKINVNSSKIGAYKQRIGDLQVDLTLLDKQRASTALRLAALDKRLQEMAASSLKAGEDKRAAQLEAVKLQTDVEAVGADVVKRCKAAAAQEKRAFAALTGAVSRFGLAESGVRKEWRAATARMRDVSQTTPDEILAGLADDQHLASMMALRASASLIMGELGRYQLTTSSANDALASSIADAAKLLGQEPPPAARDLAGYVSDEAETRKSAEKNYKAAQKDLEDVLRTHLRRSEVGRNIQWIYQGKLAEAYLGHYLLTGEKAVLDKAGELVAKAAAEKEGSPYLAAMLELRRLISGAAGRR